MKYVGGKKELLDLGFEEVYSGMYYKKTINAKNIDGGILISGNREVNLFITNDTNCYFGESDSEIQDNFERFHVDELVDLSLVLKMIKKGMIK